MYIGMIALIVICLGLMFLLAGIWRQIKKINQVLDEIIEGKTDRRILIRKYSLLSDTCYKINQIMMDNRERIIQTPAAGYRTRLHSYFSNVRRQFFNA